MTVRPTPDPAVTRAERGAAMVEFVGIMFVVAVLMAGVAGRVGAASPVPQTTWWGICRAYSTVPGVEVQCDDPSGGTGTGDPGSNPSTPGDPTPSTPTKDRAKDLSVPCVASQTNRTDTINVVAWGVRAGEGGTDEIRINADGTATVTLSQTTELGAEAAIAKGKTKGSVYGVANGELKYTYDFPDAKSAKAFLDERRSVIGRVADTVMPGAQTLNELSTRLGNWLGENVGDRMPWVNDKDRARNAQARANNTADAVSIAVGEKASASAKIGEGSVKGQAEGELSAKGEAQVFIDPSRGSSFTGTIDGKLSGGVAAQLGDPKKGLGALFGVSGQLGGKGSYKVVFGSDGQPTRLVVTGEFTHQAIGDAGLQAGNLKVPGYKEGSGGIDVKTWTLDLTDPANRAAFDGTFMVGSVSAGDYTGAVALPKLLLSPGQIAAWQELGTRIGLDSYESTYAYVLDSESVAPSDKDYSLKEGVFGGGVSIAETTRTLVDASGYDHRTGGPTVPLSTCR